MSGPKKEALMVCDVSRAFFYAPVQHEMHVELCEEAKKTVEDNNMCAKLRMHSVSQSVRLHRFCSVIPREV